VHFQKLPRGGIGYPEPPVAGVIMRENLWIVWQLLAALAVAIVLTRLARSPQFTRERRLAVVAAAALASLVLASKLAWDGWRITQQSRRDTPTFVKLGERVQRSLPPDAVLLVDERTKLETVMVMFFADRTAYRVTPNTWRATANQVIAKKGRPYVVSHNPMPLPVVIRDTGEGKTIYDAR